MLAIKCEVSAVVWVVADGDQTCFDDHRSSGCMLCHESNMCGCEPLQRELPMLSDNGPRCCRWHDCFADMSDELLDAEDGRYV